MHIEGLIDMVIEDADIDSLLDTADRQEFCVDLIKEIGSIKVYTVDDTYIRNEIDADFTNSGQHYRYDYIPEFEFWISKDSNVSERNIFIDGLLIEYRLMKAGMPYLEALDYSDRVMKAERRKKSDHIDIGYYDPRATQLVKIKQLSAGNSGDILIGIDVWLVDGELVRDLFYAGFTLGGHDYVYKYIPRNEIWIDDTVDESDITFIILHEAIERDHMKRGMEYEAAHIIATDIEVQARQGG
jgi:hypothetical protein